MRRAGVLIFCGASLIATAASAASITHQPFTNAELKGVELIVITGEIVSGDEEKFRKLSVIYDNAVVALDTRGGALLPAIEIGKLVHIKEYPTVVTRQSICTSSCALIWVAGSTRFLSPNGRVGFHASYLDVNGRSQETGLGNALVGRYLTLLNLPEKAIIFATTASPDKVLWLTSSNMKEAGIDFESFDDAPTPPPVVNIAPAPVARAPRAKPQGWVQVAFTKRVKYFIDFGRILDVRGYKSAWVKTDHSADASVKYYQGLDLWYFDCARRRLALKAFAEYDRDGQRVGGGEISPTDLEWDSVVPESVGEAQLDLVCG